MQPARAALVLLPLTFVALSARSHAHYPAAVFALALLGTAVAYLLYFWLVEHAGPSEP
jgi:drug/metabolite transporter (DMT)-like permease